MAKTYHVNFATRVRDALIMTLLRADVNMGTTSLLTVRGRTSGQPHTVPVILVEHDGHRFLVAPYGVVQWVRNLRAAATATLTRGRRSEAISVTELPAQQAAPVLKQYLLHVAAVRPYFDATVDSPPEAFELEAPRHPVFQITTMENLQKERSMKEAVNAQATPTRHQAIPAPRDVQNRATRVVASMFGVFAGLLGLEHGYFETLQGNVAPSGIMISAIGSPCQPEKMWHACQPAMTIIPNFFVTGVLAIIVSLIVILWAAAFIQRKYGGLVLILLSIIQLLVGGGFIPIPVIIIAGVVGTRINAPLTWWRAHLSVHSRRFLAALWPWSLIAYFILDLGQFILGYFFNEFMLHLSVILGVVLPLGLVLPTGCATRCIFRRSGSGSFFVASTVSAMKMKRNFCNIV